MKARCWKCGAAFKFDENRINGKALVKCPVCSARTLILENKDSDLPKFVIKPFKNIPDQTPKQAAPKPEPQTPVQEQALEPQLNKAEKSEEAKGQVVESTKVKQPPVDKNSKDSYDDLISHETPAFGDGSTELGLDKDEVFERAPAMRGIEMSDLGSPVVRGSRIVSPVKNEENEKSKGSRSSTGSDMKSQSNTKPKEKVDERKQTGQHPHIPKPPKEPSKALNYLIVILCLVSIGAALYLCKPEWFEKKSVDENVVQKIHPGKKKLNEIQKSMGVQNGDVMQLIKMGEIAYRKDLHAEYRKAEDIFKKALAIDPDNAELIVRYLESYAKLNTSNVNMGVIREFMDMLEYADTLAPGLSSIHRAKAKIYMLLEQYEKALKEAEIARRLEENNLENWITLAEVQLKLDPHQTIEILNEVVASPKPPLAAILPLAQAYQKVGKFNMAEKVLKMREEMDPDNCALCGYLGKMYESLGEDKKAEEVYLRLVEKNPEDATGHIGLANVAYMEHQSLEKVLGSLSSLPPEVIDSFSKDGKVQLFCYSSHYALLAKKTEEASMSAEKAYKLDEESLCGRYHFALTKLLNNTISVGDRQKVKKVLESLDFDLPDRPEIPVIWGLFYNQAGNLRSAITSFQKASQLYPRYYYGTLLFALMHLETVNPTQAYGVIEKLFDYPPYLLRDINKSDIYTDVFMFEDKLVELLEKVDEASVDKDRKATINGLVYFILGMNDKAERLFVKTLENNPHNLNANMFLSDIAYQRGDYVKARKYLKAVMSRHRKDPVVNYQLARIAAKEGKIKKAIKRISEEIPVNKQFAYAQIKLAELYMEVDDMQNARSAAKLAYKLNTDSAKAKSILYKVNQ